MTHLGDRLDPVDTVFAAMSAGHALGEAAPLRGRYVLECWEDERRERLIWREELDNVVCTLGKNLALDTFLAGVAYTVTGPFLGLISSSGFTAVSAADTMASHTGWVEAGIANAPTYSGGRPTAAWAAASAGAKALSAPASYTFTGSGTVQGAFMTYGTGAVATVDNTAGTLLSASAFGTGQPVISGNVLTLSYSLSM